jgi:hypothetical protein
LEPEQRQRGLPRSVPWSVAEQAREQAYRNHEQTLERLAQRGGLCPRELLTALRGHGLRLFATEADAEAALLRIAAGEDWR